MCVCRLQASPEFEAWARKSSRRQQLKLLGRILALVLLCGGTLALLQQLPPHLRLPVAVSSFVSELSAQHRAKMAVKQRELEDTLARLDTALQELQAAQKAAEDSQRREEQLSDKLSEVKRQWERDRRTLAYVDQTCRDTLKACGPWQKGIWLTPRPAMGLAALVLYALLSWSSAARSARALRAQVAALREAAEAQEVGGRPCPALVLCRARPGPPGQRSLALWSSACGVTPQVLGRCVASSGGRRCPSSALTACQHRQVCAPNRSHGHAATGEAGDADRPGEEPAGVHGAGECCQAAAWRASWPRPQPSDDCGRGQLESWRRLPGRRAVSHHPVLCQSLNETAPMMVFLR